ncbi:MAG: leucine-rich repeat protein [Eisenbergiella tayi]|uniref:leucine-rich repeat protein n=1 Tax=Eisenbergiella tayi TaxID=1432052 RepID=UPI0039995000
MRNRKHVCGLSLLLCAVLLAGQLGTTIYAEGTASDTEGLCEHHPEHTAECGYVEAVEGHPCEHVHTDDCYTDQLICGYEEENMESASDSDAAHEHTKECYELDCPHERGEHDEDCGYKEAVEGHSCGFNCEECSKESKQVSGNDLPEQEFPETNIEKSEETTVFVLTAFEALGEKTQYQTVTAGTKLSELDLPNTLSASGYPLEKDKEHISESVTITDVTWESDTKYDENAGQGSYLFTPVLPTGYTCERDVELPEIYVRIGAANVVLDVQDDVLDVTFNSNGSGGNSMDDNEMKKAIDAVLTGKKANITTIKLTGNVKEITRYNWKYLLEQYYIKSDWDNLTTLDLSGMTDLETIMNNTHTAKDNMTKMQMLYLPDSLKIIREYAFYGCRNLKLQSLPDGLKQIGDEAFYGCERLELQSLPKGLTQIGNSAFWGCKSLALQSLPENLTQIENYVFNGCTSLALQSLPKDLTQIGDSAFYGCNSLVLQSLPVDLKQIGDYVFYGCNSLVLQSLPVDLKQIGDYAFYGCERLELQSLPVDLKQIGDEAFYGCERLELQSLPKGLTQIGDEAFYGCKNLALQSLPVDLTQIGVYAFSGCTGLSSIIMESSTAPAISSSTFNNTNTGLTFYIPKNGNGYDSGNWENLNTVEYTPISALVLDRNTLQLGPGQSETLAATVIPTDASYKAVSWKSSNTGVAIVDSSGRVTAVSIGTATITVTSQYGKKTATCAVTVNSPISNRDNDHSSPRGSDSNITITPLKPSQPDSPERTVAEIPVTVKDGMAIGTASDDSTWEALIRALHTARQKGRAKYGITMQYSVTSAAVYDSFSIIIKRATLDRLADPDNGIKYLTLHTPIVDLTFDLAALQEIQKQSIGDITLTAARETGLTGDMLAAVGTRPAYRLTVGYTGQGGKAAFVTSFGTGRVTVRLAYKPAADEQTGSLFLVYSKDGKNTEWLYQSSYDLGSGNLIGSTGHFSVYGVGYKPAPAYADTMSHWAKEDINFVASRGMLGGTDENAFVPDGIMTQGMLVLALGQLAGIDPAAYPSVQFSDADAAAYYAPYVEWASSKGIINGTGEKTFAPDAAVTREEIAVMMKRYVAVLGYTLPIAREAEIFTDNNKITGSMKSAVQTMQQAGVMNSKGNHLFAPKDTVTRAEAVAILRRFVETVIDPYAAGGRK